MKNGRNLIGTRCRVRWAAAMALGAVVVLAPSLAWSQDRGQPGLIPLPHPGDERNKTLTTYTPPFEAVNPFDRVRNFIPLPHPGDERNKTLTTYTAQPFATAGPFDRVRNFIPLPVPGGERNKTLTTYGSDDGGLAFHLRRVVMAAFP